VADGVPTDSVVNFDNIHTIRAIGYDAESPSCLARRMAEACRVLQAATGC
jgi:mRNA interferase MazF